MMASGQGYKSIVQLLVKSGGNVNETSNVSERTSMNVYWKPRNFIENVSFANFIRYLDLQKSNVCEDFLHEQIEQKFQC